MKYNSLIIIPTYNEAENIEAVIKKVIDLEDKNDILVIDDNSPDGTSKIVENQKNIYNNRVFLIKREKKSGLGSAYKAGFKWALKNNYSYIFEMDADMSHDPNEIKNLKIQLSQNKYDVVVGSRYIEGVSVVNWPLSRIFLSYAANLYVRIITGMPIKDATSGFVGYTKNALNSIELSKIKFNGYAFQIEMKFKLWKKNFKLKEHQIIFVNRKLGKSKMNLLHIIQYFYRLLILRFST